jgi:acetyl esterase/lipase
VRRAVLLTCVLAALLAGCGGPDVERLTVGRGAQAAEVLRGEGAGRPVVVFLHGWTAADPRAYGAWKEHLVAEGADVIAPVYQEPPYANVRTPLPNVIAAVRAGLSRLPGHGPVLAAGHSAGGALSVDLAASAREAGLPRVEAVYAVYPGRDLGLRGFLAGPPLSRVPAGTRLLVLGSPTDVVVGTGTARAIVADASRVRGELRTIRDPVLGAHNAPLLDGEGVRATFWSPLDQLLREAEARADP